MRRVFLHKLGQLAEVSVAEEQLEEPVVSNVVLLSFFVPTKHVNENRKRRRLFFAQSSYGLHIAHDSSWPEGVIFLVAISINSLDAVNAIAGFKCRKGCLGLDPIDSAMFSYWWLFGGFGTCSFLCHFDKTWYPRVWTSIFMHFFLQHSLFQIDPPLPFPVLLPMILQILFKLIKAILEVPLIITPLLNIKFDMILHPFLEFLLLFIYLLLVLVGLLPYLVEFIKILWGLFDDEGLFGGDRVFDLRIEPSSKPVEGFFYGVGVLRIGELGGVNRFNFIHWL